ncbi:MAG: anthranilate synthase component I, partial [Chloroflexota bacterium]|nr:anthranilate synthase component I [Chloroflexota bacterium]
MIESSLHLSPTLEEVRSAAGTVGLDSRRTNAIPISCEILADLDTPVSAYLKIRDTGPSFLLESVTGGERIGRYSYLGSGPRDVLRLKDGVLTDREGAIPCSDPLQAIRTIVDRYGPQSRSESRFGGALGYLSYEAARYFERLPLPGTDALDLPDAAF